MTVSRLRDIPGIGVDAVGDAADAAGDPELLRLENLDTDIRPPDMALAATRAAVDDEGTATCRSRGIGRCGRRRRRTVTDRGAGLRPATECVSVAGGLNGILNALLATVEPGQEWCCDPISRAWSTGCGRRAESRAASRPRPRRPRGLRGLTRRSRRRGRRATAAVLMMGPAMPTGLVLGDEHSAALGQAVTGMTPG